MDAKQTLIIALNALVEVKDALPKNTFVDLLMGKGNKEIEENEVLFEEYLMDDAEICVVSFGITARVAKNAIVEARAKQKPLVQAKAATRNFGIICLKKPLKPDI